MNKQRLIQSAMLCLKRGTLARGRYLKEKHIFGAVGDQVRYQPRLIPLYPELIRLHNNIVIGAGVRFVTHDATYAILNQLGRGHFPEKVGCIEIMDNVFIGFNCTILDNVRIGENCIVGANTLVNKDLEAGGVYAGIPARRIGNFEDFVTKRSHVDYPTVEKNQRITKKEIQKAWAAFEEQRK